MVLVPSKIIAHFLLGVPPFFLLDLEGLFLGHNGFHRVDELLLKDSCHNHNKK